MNKYLLLLTCIVIGMLLSAFTLFKFWKPSIYVDNLFVDMGNISADCKNNITHEFIIKNNGIKPLQIFNIETSCRCIVVDYVDEKILPKGSGKLKVSVHLDKKYWGRINGGIVFKTNDPSNAIVALKLNAHILFGAAIFPVEINFGKMIVGEKRECMAEIICSSSQMINNFKWSLKDLSTKEINVKLDSVTKCNPVIGGISINDGWVIKFKINITAIKPQKDRIDEIIFFTNLKDYEVLSLPIKWSVYKEKYFEPSNLFFGAIKYNAFSLRSISFISEVDNVDVDSVFFGSSKKSSLNFEIKSINKVDAKRTEINLALKSMRPLGRVQDTLCIKTKNGGMHETVISVLNIP